MDPRHRVSLPSRRGETRSIRVPVEESVGRGEHYRGTASRHPERARRAPRRRVALFVVNSALAGAHTELERTNERASEPSSLPTKRTKVNTVGPEGQTDGHVIASRRLGWRRACSCSFHRRPCREDGRGRVNSGAPLPEFRVEWPRPFPPPFAHRSALVELSARPAGHRRIAGAAAGVPTTMRG